MALYQDLQLEKQEKQSRVAELGAEIKDLQDQLAYLQSLLKEPWQTTCAECGSVLIITPPTDVVPQVLTMLYCPVCEAEVWEAPTEGYTITPAIVGEEPWYKKYAPHLAIGGGLAATLIYLSTKKRG